MSEESPKSHGNGRATSAGYLVEWRLKPGSEVIADINAYDDVKTEWRRAPYTATKMVVRPGEAQLVRPVIRGWLAEQMAEHDVVSQDVGDAIIACLKTSIRHEMRPHIEWRLNRVELQTSYSIVEIAEDDRDREEFQRSIDETLERHRP